MLEVRLIGKFEIKCDGKPITISTRLAQSLFAYLILTAGTLHRREKLAGMFWPGATEEKARRSLRQELWRIRKALSSESQFDYLIADDLHIAFNASAAYSFDVITLTKGGVEESVTELMNVLSVCQGELLPGFYDEWIILEREHLRVVYEQKMSRLLKLLESAKCWNDILDWGERWILSGQAPETAYRALITAYDALGDRAKVASTYERCIQALQTLDLEPSEQTRALAFKRVSRLHIPVPLTNFIGRDRELKEVASLFSKSRLVTLTGSGGVGKTRLSLQVVAEVLDRFPDGVWFLDLAPLTDPALVPGVLADLIGWRESGERAITDLLIDYFKERAALVIFDNCEHLIESCAQLVHVLLTGCERLAVLATSREPLRVAGEIPYRVPSLQLPRLDLKSFVEGFGEIESVRLFIERAAIVSPGFAIKPQNVVAIAQICQQLDGIPLAIELAAARVRALSVHQIAARLDDRFRLLTGGSRTALPRQQTLQAAIDWSYQLLSEPERLVLRRLSVFSGGFTLEAAEEVCALGAIESGEILERLTHLVDKSLLMVETDKSEARYSVLETIRQYARDKLVGAGEIDEVRGRHFTFFLALAEEAEMGLHSPERKAWLERLELEHDNLRAALAWSLEQVSSRLESGLRLAGALFNFWEYRGYDHEGREWLGRILKEIDRRNVPVTKPACAKAHYALGMFLWTLPDYQQTEAHAQESLRLYQELRHEEGIARALNLLGTNARAQRDYARAILLFERSLAICRTLGDTQGICEQLLALAFVWWRQGEYRRAESLLEEALTLSYEAKDHRNLAEAKSALATVASAKGHYDQANLLWQESLRIFEELGDKSWIAGTLQDLGFLSWRQGDYLKAEANLKGSIELFREIGAQRAATRSLGILGDLTLSQGDVQGARSIYEEVAAIDARLGDKLDQSCAQQRLANVAFAARDYSTAQALSQESLSQFRAINSQVDSAGSLLVLGNIEAVRGNLEAALDSYRASLRIRCELHNLHDIAATLEQIASVATKKGQFARAARLLGSAAQMREQVGAPLEPIAHAEHEQDLAAIKAGLSEQYFATEWTVGRALSTEQVIDFAMEESDA